MTERQMLVNRLHRQRPAYLQPVNLSWCDLHEPGMAMPACCCHMTTLWRHVGYTRSPSTQATCMRRARPMPTCAMSPSPPISLEVSTITTRLFCASDSSRAISRTTVVFPTPGRPCVSAPLLQGHILESWGSVTLWGWYAQGAYPAIKSWTKESEEALRHRRVTGAHHEEDGLPGGHNVSSHGRTTRDCPAGPASQAHDAAVAVAHTRYAVQRAIYACSIVIPKFSQLHGVTGKFQGMDSACSQRMPFVQHGVHVCPVAVVKLLQLQGGTCKCRSALPSSHKELTRVLCQETSVCSAVPWHSTLHLYGCSGRRSVAGHVFMHKSWICIEMCSLVGHHSTKFLRMRMRKDLADGMVQVSRADDIIRQLQIA